jgi:acetolactate synthase-1/2/3 large subunit
MKLAEALALMLERHGVRHVFGVSGGANLHLIHGICDATKIQFIPTTHECNAGFAADAYARVAGLGVAMVTSGPGATNLVTAIATSYYDSVPVLYITGNVATHRQSKPLGVRQYGFQDHDIVGSVMGFVNGAYELVTPDELENTLEMLLHLARTNRRGPVLLDIPDDLQRAELSYCP